MDDGVMLERVFLHVILERVLRGKSLSIMIDGKSVESNAWSQDETWCKESWEKRVFLLLMIERVVRGKSLSIMKEWWVFRSWRSDESFDHDSREWCKQSFRMSRSKHSKESLSIHGLSKWSKESWEERLFRSWDKRHDRKSRLHWYLPSRSTTDRRGKTLSIILFRSWERDLETTVVIERVFPLKTLSILSICRLLHPGVVIERVFSEWSKESFPVYLSSSERVDTSEGDK